MNFQTEKKNPKSRVSIRNLWDVNVGSILTRFSREMLHAKNYFAAGLRSVRLSGFEGVSKTLEFQESDSKALKELEVGFVVLESPWLF